MKIEIPFQFLSHIRCRIISVRLVAKWLKKWSQLVVSLLGITQPAQGQEASQVDLWELDFFLQFWKPNRWHPCQISQHLLCASASAERFALLCPDYSSYCLLVLSYCPTETIWLDYSEPVATIIHSAAVGCVGSQGALLSAGPWGCRGVSRGRLAKRRTGGAVRTWLWWK